MDQTTKNYIYQYKVLFYLSWLFLYFIFPTWISLHSILQAKGLSQLSDPLARSIAILGLIIYFFIAADLISRYFNTLVLDKPVIIRNNCWIENITNNTGLVIICVLAAVLHLPFLSLVEVGFLRQGLLMYDLSNSYWSRLFDFPIQYGFWLFLVTGFLLLKQTKLNNVLLSVFNNIYRLAPLLKILFMLGLFGILSAYSLLFPYSSQDALQWLRFPPVLKYLYLITYYAFGVSDTGPRIVQLIFYIIGAVNIYRTILLYREKGAALLGATIYLFSPVMFHYASYAAFACGTVFFMTLISFHFLRFIKGGDDRDLVLTSFFIGIGFMYKRVLLVMFIICFSYLVISKIIRMDRHSIKHFKILLLSLLTVMPFFTIGKISGINFYAPILSNLLSFDFIYLVIQSQISAVLSLMILLSLFFILFKRDDLSLFFGLYFIAYYIFFTLSLAPATQRYSMALYPAIAVLLAQIIFRLTQHIRWKHSFKLVFLILTVYLVFLCLVPRSSTNLITFKYKDFESQYYPFDKAVDWFRDKTKNDDKVLSLFIPGNIQLYMERIYSDKNSINNKKFIYYYPGMGKELIYPFQNFLRFCYAEKISYIMIPYGPRNDSPDIGASKEAKYLKENSDKELIEVARFNNEDNYVLIYKIK